MTSCVFALGCVTDDIRRKKKARHSKNSGLSLNLLRCMQAALPKGN